MTPRKQRKRYLSKAETYLRWRGFVNVPDGKIINYRHRVSSLGKMCMCALLTSWDDPWDAIWVWIDVNNDESKGMTTFYLQVPEVSGGKPFIDEWAHSDCVTLNKCEAHTFARAVDILIANKNYRRDNRIKDGWVKLRYEALKKYGPRCQLCGRGPSPQVEIQVDHIKPQSIFPELARDINNLQILCRECNIGKSNRDQTDWRPALVA